MNNEVLWNLALELKEIKSEEKENITDQFLGTVELMRERGITFEENILLSSGDTIPEIPIDLWS